MRRALGVLGTVVLVCALAGSALGVEKLVQVSVHREEISASTTGILFDQSQFRADTQTAWADLLDICVQGSIETATGRIRIAVGRKVDSSATNGSIDWLTVGYHDVSTSDTNGFTICLAPSVAVCAFAEQEGLVPAVLYGNVDTTNDKIADTRHAFLTTMRDIDDTGFENDADYYYTVMPTTDGGTIQAYTQAGDWVYNVTLLDSVASTVDFCITANFLFHDPQGSN